MSKDKTVELRQKKLKEALLEQLKRTPTVETACQKVGVGRATVYRWRDQSKGFKEQMESALNEGRIFMSDIAENQLFALIGEKKYEAIRLYLSTHNPRYSNKLEVTGSVSTDKPLTKEQKKLIREALKLSSVRHYGKKKKN
ncbi:MAG: hypothetical protein K9M10_03505 [Candidatus Pacebacteria bacterium]|nr:hypothetical protein [Candidatus Paceibacterota bacterium]MCF7857517.1 hypothetical protein [Candidatus Paceibacterota bacterium]